MIVIVMIIIVIIVIMINKARKGVLARKTEVLLRKYGL